MQAYKITLPTVHFEAQENLSKKGAIKYALENLLDNPMNVKVEVYVQGLDTNDEHWEEVK